MSKHFDNVKLSVVRLRYTILFVLDCGEAGKFDIALYDTGNYRIDVGNTEPGLTEILAPFAKEDGAS